MIKVFISHSSEDVSLAKAVIDLIRSALVGLQASEIRCTSVPGHKLPGGAKTEEQVRKELLAAPVFIGLVTEASLASKFVLFELGARWGADQELIPLLAPGISPCVLEGPISNINALSCSIAADLHALVQQVAKILSLKLEPPTAYQNALEIVTASPATIPPAPPGVAVAQVPQEAVDELAELRSEAVTKILNCRISTDAEMEALTSYTNGWWERVKAVLEKNFSKAEQLNFTRLGTVPKVTFDHRYNSKHAKILREFALQDRRLLDIIARHTR